MWFKSLEETLGIGNATKVLVIMYFLPTLRVLPNIWMGSITDITTHFYNQHKSSVLLTVNLLLFRLLV